MNKTLLQVKDIRTDGGTQPRAAVDFKLVAEYAEAMTEGVEFPPVTVFYDGSSYWLADGFHRLFATKKAGKPEIIADVIQGTHREAVLHSLGVNETHGFRRSPDDKRRAVIRMFKDDEWSKWSLNQIAKACRVSAGLVHKVFHDPEFDFSREKSAERTGADGRTINTEKIGKTKPAPPETVEPAKAHPGQPERDLSEFTRERYVKTYSPPSLPDADEESDLLDEPLPQLDEPLAVTNELEDTDLEPYVPPHAKTPHRKTVSVRPLPSGIKPKEPPFVVGYDLLGKVRSAGHRLFVDGLISIEEATQEGALENRINDVIEMLQGALHQAKEERKTLEAVSA